MSHETWERWKKIMPTIWGADWDDYGIADYYIMKN